MPPLSPLTTLQQSDPEFYIYKLSVHKHISDEDGRTEDKDVKKFMGGRTTDRF